MSATDELSDEVLLAAYRDGDEGAFATLFARHRDGVLRLAARLLGSRAEAEEVCVESFARLVRTRPRKVRPWLYTVAHRQCLDRLKHRERAGRGGRKLVALPSPDPEGHAVRAERGRRLDAALAELSVEHRAVISLYYGEGLSSAEVGVVLGLRPDQVRSRAAYAVRLLRSALTPAEEIR